MSVTLKILSSMGSTLRELYFPMASGETLLTPTTPFAVFVICAAELSNGGVLADNDVVAVEHGKGVVTDKGTGLKHGVTETFVTFWRRKKMFAMEAMSPSSFNISSRPPLGFEGCLKLDGVVEVDPRLCPCRGW